MNIYRISSLELWEDLLAAANTVDLYLLRLNWLIISSSKLQWEVGRQSERIEGEIDRKRAMTTAKATILSVFHNPEDCR